MRGMLITDAEYFSAQFPSAVEYIRAADLRHEMYRLLCEKELTVWAQKRLNELDECPACREPWFVEKIRLERGYEVSDETTKTEYTD